jgi:hypothetical protein
VHYFLPPIPQSVHLISEKNDLYTGLSVHGQVMRDWLADGQRAPEQVVDRVAEGAIVVVLPAVLPFACDVAH